MNFALTNYYINWYLGIEGHFCRDFLIGMSTVVPWQQEWDRKLLMQQKPGSKQGGGTCQFNGRRCKFWVDPSEALWTTSRFTPPQNVWTCSWFTKHPRSRLPIPMISAPAPVNHGMVHRASEGVDCDTKSVSHVVHGLPDPHGEGRRLLFGQVPLPALLVLGSA